MMLEVLGITVMVSPYSNLYTNPQECKFSKKLITTETGYENDFNQQNNDINYFLI